MPHYVTKLWGKKLLAWVAKRTCFCFVRWASSLANGMQDFSIYK